MDLLVFKGERFYVDGKLGVSIFQKEENKYMYIPAKSGHQKHTINNFILGELRRYVRFNTLERNFTKIKCKFFKRLRNRGYENFFLTRLFCRIKFGCRNKLLKISEDIIDEFEIGTQRSDSVLIEDAERMFQHVFSEVILPMENIQENIHTVCIDSLPTVVTVQKVCLRYYQHYFRKKTYGTKKIIVVSLFVFYPFFRQKKLLKG
jgi:hypothetical protein